MLERQVRHVGQRLPYRCLGGDVDTYGTYIAGSEELIAEVLADSGLEAYQVQAGDKT